MKVYTLTLLLIISVFQSDSLVFTRCKLTRELLKMKLIEKTFLGSWVCLIEKVSQRDTAAYREASGKKYYGLYQIKDVWCKNGKRGGKCNIACEALLDDDIRDDTECAVQIYEQEGFQYWTQWMKRCKNDNFITNEIYK
ncbi:lysozyme-like [Aphomia sociella]